jgi:hypothetical protein
VKRSPLAAAAAALLATRKQVQAAEAGLKGAAARLQAASSSGKPVLLRVP